MNLSKITNHLNDKQHQSVILKNQQNALILAGAGSGKTRVLIHRIAYLITQKNTDADSILAVTFTNKAASEMRERLSALLARPINSMWLGTFHGLAHRLLRTHPVEANLSRQFQITDAQDQLRIIKRIMRENSIDEAKFPTRKMVWFINQQKNEGISADDIDAGHNYFTKKSVEIFALYEAYCRENELIDFAELLLRSYQLLKNNAEILKHYQNLFQHILIDEFQDTNTMQYKWIKLLFSGKNSVFCVGDDDQSIYAWRGAKIENMQKLETDFKPIKIIKLEQNYRSTGNILAASNALIAHNTNRLEKNLWTQTEDGDLIDLYQAKNETDEANFIVNKVQKYLKQGANPNDCAVLYRSNVQSRVFEEVLIAHNIAYIIYGGLRFFERAEIKDALCYLRLIENKTDNVAFERVLNFPSRGIGNASLEKIREFASQHNTSLFLSATNLISTLPTRASQALARFCQLIEEMTAATQHLDLSEKIDYLIKKSGLLQHYENDKTDKAGSKKDNLNELITAAKQYHHSSDSEVSATLGFIALASLDAHRPHTPEHQSVQLMTIHAAKGLEFPYVFLSGMEENLFPSRQSLDSPHLIAEERRLCYVGMTRAQTKLTLSFALKRLLYGQTQFARPSRFLQEIPKKYLNLSQQNNQNYQNDVVFNAIESQPHKQLSIGESVKHAKFGFGIVLNFEGNGTAARVQVKFHKFGVKWLIISYANLQTA